LPVILSGNLCTELKITKEYIEGMDGGFSKRNLSKLGVPWPPPKGWKYALEHGYHFDDNGNLINGSLEVPEQLIFLPNN